VAQIELEGVGKTFTVAQRQGRLRRERKTVHAVEDISFSVEAGSMVGYIGPNGAGKSTTIKMLTGILVPSTGRVSVAGLDPSRRRMDVARRLGVVFGQRTQLWWDLPLRDSFELLRHVYRVPAGRHGENLAAFVDLLDLGPLLDTPVRQLSLGQRMRGDIVAALLHDPDIVLLDEPTIGLDVMSKEVVRCFLAELNEREGTTVILTTHDLADVERLCRRLLIIDRGRDRGLHRGRHQGPLRDRANVGRRLGGSGPAPGGGRHRDHQGRGRAPMAAVPHRCPHRRQRAGRGHPTSRRP
jgi:ABC-2 type transport system ATP-binding protein